MIADGGTAVPSHCVLWALGPACAWAGLSRQSPGEGAGPPAPSDAAQINNGFFVSKPSSYCLVLARAVLDLLVNVRQRP